jgi:hypothetical protein
MKSPKFSVFLTYNYTDIEMCVKVGFMSYARKWLLLTETKLSTKKS